MCEVHVLYSGYSMKLSDGTMKANCSCTLIKASKNVIVDTMTAWDKNNIVEALMRHNLTPDDIDYVICTHSHADHIGNNNLFLKAEHMIGTCVHRENIFFESKLENDSAYAICPSVIVLATPGHTADDVTVLARSTVNGKSTCFAITGDLFEKVEDISDPSIWKNLGTVELQKVQAKWRSYIINTADFIIPGHGPMFSVNSEMRKMVMDQKLQLMS